MTATIVPFFQGPANRVMNASEFNHGSFLPSIEQQLINLFQEIREEGYNFSFSFGEPYNTYDGSDAEHTDLCTVCTVCVNGSQEPLYIDIEENVRQENELHVIASPNISLRTKVRFEDGSSKQIFNMYRVKDIFDMSQWLKRQRSVTDLDFRSCIRNILHLHAQASVDKKDIQPAQKPR